jgi:hypothetical protein
LSIVQNSVLNSLSFERVFRENRRSISSQAVAGVCSIVHVKSILGVGPKVKESIKNPSGRRSGWEAFTIGFVPELKV